ncbi:MAG: hypothetical protein ACT4NY_07605 [Pseudonocardiales bacterium]
MCFSTSTCNSRRRPARLVRRRDMIISQRVAQARVAAEGGLIRASEVLVVVEIVSPGARRADHVTKAVGVRRRAAVVE